MNFIEPGDRVRILRGKHAGETGIVAYFNHGNSHGVPYKNIIVQLDKGGHEARFKNEGALEKLEENQPEQPMTAPDNQAGKP